MQEAWPESVSSDQGVARARTLAVIADDLASDTVVYMRYGYEMTNAMRSDYARKATGLNPKDFSILLPFPFDEWLISEDLSLIRSGLFILDMRFDAIQRARAKLGLDESWMFVEQAEAEHYGQAFYRRAAAMELGSLIPEQRVLN